MPLLDADALAGLNAYMSGETAEDQGSGFPDGAIRSVFSPGARDSYNRKVPSFSAGTEIIPCRIRPLTVRELAQYGSNQLNEATNVAHFPPGTDIRGVDHLRHVERWGQPLGRSVEYSVVGDPAINALEITVQLKLITNIKE